jgi:hypothetical protein
MHWLLSSAFPHKYVRWKCYIVVCAQFLRYVVMHKVCFPSRQPQPTMDHYGLQNNGGIMRRPCGVRSQKGMWNTILVWCTEFFFAWRNHYFRNIAFFLRFGSDFLVFFLMGCRPRLKNHEQFVTNQQAPSRNHSEGEKFNKIMHHQTCIQHTYIDKIRGCCKRNMWKLAWVPRMHPETGLTQQFLELKFCHVRALSSYFL